MEKYTEIKELHEYCKKIKVISILEPIFDGYAIRFPNGSDFIQHRGSYGAEHGCVEPAIGNCKYDYTAVTLERAKKLVRRYKRKLNKGGELHG